MDHRGCQRTSSPPILPKYWAKINIRLHHLQNALTALKVATIYVKVAWDNRLLKLWRLHCVNAQLLQLILLFISVLSFFFFKLCIRSFRVGHKWRPPCNNLAFIAETRAGRFQCQSFFFGWYVPTWLGRRENGLKKKKNPENWAMKGKYRWDWDIRSILSSGFVFELLLEERSAREPLRDLCYFSPFFFFITGSHSKWFQVEPR